MSDQSEDNRAAARAQPGQALLDRRLELLARRILLVPDGVTLTRSRHPRESDALVLAQVRRLTLVEPVTARTVERVDVLGGLIHEYRRAA
jgi:hypothetical protein